MNLKGTEKTFSVCTERENKSKTYQEPTIAEIEFTKKIVGDLNGLFLRSKPAIDKAWKDWVKTQMPDDWTTVLSLNGFSVPTKGDVNKPWGATFYCKPAGHYFCINLRKGKAYLESVDG